VIRSLGEGASGNGAARTPPGPSSPRADTPARAEAPPRADFAPRGAARGPLASAAPAELPAAAQIAPHAEFTAPALTLASFEDLVALAAEKRDLVIKSALERDVRLVRFEDGRLEIGLEASAAKTLTGELSKKLSDWTGRRWMVIVSAETGRPSLKAQAETRKAELKDGVRGDPLVQAVLARFPGAEIVDVRPPAGEPAALGDAHAPFDSPGETGRPDDEQ
jgi:DNA polymerase III subunit gamma/tau